MNAFGKWLDEGRSWRSGESHRNALQKLLAAGPLGTDSERSWLRKLRAATPLDGVKIVGRLTSKPEVSDVGKRAIEIHPHGLVRFAGFFTGLCTNLGAAIQDENHWIRELAKKMPQPQATSDLSSFIVENPKDRTLLIVIPDGEYQAGGDDAVRSPYGFRLIISRFIQ